ncbi:DUF397 domain-containing protein [Streptomyces sp. NPDC059010]|uniref:DUF397 domain-containing protein n=1 Tax=Streptomyces sp. NPDC059010 TaxID=3346695 RepID=UPI0036C20225
MVSSEHTVSDSSALTGWYKSSYSAGDQGECLEVATTPDTVRVRDSKDKQGPQLVLSPSAWADFTSYAAGE